MADTVTFRTMNGRKSIDRRIASTISYINEHLNKELWESRAEAREWAKNTLEGAIVGIASSCYAYVEDKAE